MAFDATQKEQLVSILGGDATTTLLTAHLDRLGAALTVEKQTYIESQMTRWDSVGGMFGGMVGNERNFGRFLNASEAKADIRGNIARSLEWPYSVAVAGMGTLIIG